MVSDPDRRRRGPTVVVATAVIVIALGAFLFIRSRSPERSVSAYCSKMESAKSLGVALGDLDPDGIAQPYKALRAARDVAPSEIEPQMTVLVDYTAGLVAALERTSTDPVETATSWFEQHASEAEQITSAGNAVRDYTIEHCGIELDEAPRTIPD